MTKIGENDRIEGVVNRTRASISSREITSSGMSTTKTEDSTRLVFAGKDRDARSANSRVGYQFRTVEYWSIVWSSIQLTIRDMHLTSQKRVAASVADQRERNAILPTAGSQPIVQNATRGDDHSGSVTGKIVVSCCSRKTGRSISVITNVITCCPANDEGN